MAPPTSRRSSSWLASAESAGVTGRVFEVEGGAVGVDGRLAVRPARAARAPLAAGGARRDRRRAARARAGAGSGVRGVSAMGEAYIVDAVRTPVGRRERRARQRVHPADLGAHVLRALVERTGHRPAGRRGRRLRLRRHDRPAGRRHRAHLLARGRAARRGAGRDDRPPVRLVAAGGALRRAGGDERHAATWSSPAACRT